MTGTQAVAAIESWHGPENDLGLIPIRTLLDRLGNPQTGLKFIHVAGSNGKGSTCAMLASILQHAGYRTGLFTSPYIQDFRERIRIDGELISGKNLAAITEEVLPLAREIPGIRQFALITAIAMVYFRRQNCDIVVLEVGMGGIVDATNVIDCPEAAVITNIGLEHTAILGRTIEEIAEKKAGIIKSGGHAVCYDGNPAVTEIVRRRCEAVGASPHCADNDKLTLLRQDLTGQTFCYEGKNYTLPLLGQHQLHNAAVVLETVDVLRQRGWTISPDCVHAGLSAVQWPARFEVLCRQPLFILDGGHNPQCARSLAHTLGTCLPGQKICCIMGVMDDKDADAMADAVAPQTAQFYCVSPDSERAMPAQSLAARLRAAGMAAEACTSAAEAVEKALGSGYPAAAFGSLYLAGEIRMLFPRLCKRFQRRQCLDARQALSPTERQEKSQAICRQLLNLPEVKNAQAIFSYAAAEDEVDLSMLHRLLAQQGKTAAYPVILPRHRMEARAPLSDADWITGTFGIPSPDPRNSLPVDPAGIDLVLVPCVGFDGQLHRLGHGGGYYDRWLSEHPQIPRIAVAFEAQHLITVMTDTHDLPMDKIVTEDAVYPAT